MSVFKIAAIGNGEPCPECGLPWRMEQHMKCLEGIIARGFAKHNGKPTEVTPLKEVK